ncbi:nuclease-related domain-containing protein [Gammaproteobacteria bacterium AB-CW1]|uniref:Nuclease-related domain-containing protein n=1 Tax=Natronospira elongata TaxID=3110268 RepID=A0AAP6MKN1_9GAMM|nr:nuclease-related domain-containing protein [Gammaproteobacteria bacterium AB-CW1]
MDSVFFVIALLAAAWIATCLVGKGRDAGSRRRARPAPRQPRARHTAGPAQGQNGRRGDGKPEVNEGQRRAGEEAERRFRQMLQTHAASLPISGHLDTDNIVLPMGGGRGESFQLDHVVLVRNRCLVVVEIKNWGGELRVSDRRKWRQIREHRNGQTECKKLNNPIVQVERSARLFNWLLERHGLSAAPITRAVVIMNDRTRLTGLETLSPKTPVFQGEAFLNYLQKLGRVLPPRPGINRGFFDGVVTALESHARPHWKDERRAA